MPYLEILRAWLPAGVATFWSDCRGRQCLNKVFPSSQKLCCEVEGSTWFNMVQHGSTTFYSLIIASSFCHWVSLKHNALECVDAGNGQSEAMKHSECHNLAHRILLSACAHCRALLSQSRQRQWVWACLNNVLSQKLVIASLIFFIFLPCFRKGCGAVQVPNRQFVMHTLIWIHFIQRSTQLLPT